MQVLSKVTNCRAGTRTRPVSFPASPSFTWPTPGHVSPRWRARVGKSYRRKSDSLVCSQVYMVYAIVGRGAGIVK